MSATRLFLSFLCAIVLMVATLPFPPAQAADGIGVEINKGTLIRLPGQATVVAVADPEIADIEVLAPNLVSVQGRGVGQTSIIAFNHLGDEILNDTITVSHNVSKLHAILRSVMPDADVQFQSMDGALVVSGTVASPLEADNVRKLVEPFLGEDAFVNLLHVEGSDQVLLKVRIAEVSRAELKRFGINLYTAITSGSRFAFDVVTGRDILPDANGIIPRGPDNNNIGIGYESGDVDVNSVIDALAQDNVIKILAEPNLTTASGRSANFLAGGEFPIPVPGENGQVTIEYRQYGVGLKFTPHVLSKNKISLTVAPEVSELSRIGAVELQGFTVPALTTRRAETTVELGSGQSFAIAGLLQNKNSNNINKFPGLGDIPILGALFRSTEFQNDQSELVIIVTPYTVRPVPAGQLADPTQGHIAPTDAERILQGHSYTPEKPAPATDSPPATTLDGTPADLRRPDYRRAVAQERQGRPGGETLTPAAPAVKSTPAPNPAPRRDAPRHPPVSRSIAPAPAEAAPQAVPTPPPALNGPVGYRLR